MSDKMTLIERLRNPQWEEQESAGPGPYLSVHWTRKAMDEAADTLSNPAQRRIKAAMGLIERYGGIDGDHHKTWVIDQVARALLGDAECYESWVVEMKNGEDGPETYDWDVGIPP